MRDHHNASWERRESWPGAERRAGGGPSGRMVGERALLGLVVAILLVAAATSWARPPEQRALSAPARGIGVLGAPDSGTREAMALLDAAGAGLALDTAARGPEGLRALLADSGVCVALAVAPPGDLAQARRLADAASGADKPVVLVLAGVDPTMRLLNRGNSRLAAVSTPAEGAARALALARLHGCAPRVEAAPLPALG